MPLRNNDAPAQTGPAGHVTETSTSTSGLATVPPFAMPVMVILAADCAWAIPPTSPAYEFAPTDYLTARF